MPKTVGEWLFIASIIGVDFLRAINQMVATFCLVGGLIFGYQEGFDIPLVVTLSVFVLLLPAELISSLFLKPEIILKFTWPNLFVTVVKLAYLVIAGLLFYGLWEGGLEKYYWIYLAVAVWLTAINLPWMLFHLALCFRSYREKMSKLNAQIRSTQIRCICTKKCDCQNPPPKGKRWDRNEGVWHISNECPEHNDKPAPNPDCPVDHSAD